MVCALLKNVRSYNKLMVTFVINFGKGKSKNYMMQLTILFFGFCV